MRVTVVPYDPTWPEAFEALREQLGASLVGVDVLAIEHVGSTSVPGLAAKPIIDIDVVVARDVVPEAIAALENRGHTYKGELGVPERHVLDAPDDDPKRNVYIAVDGCLALRNHLAVRSVLRADRDLRDRYGALKLDLSRREYESIDGYIDDKSAVLQVVLERAGFTEAERDEIFGINRDEKGS